MRIAGIIDESIVDGPGIRTTIFFQGCPHHCPGCHNPDTFDFKGGKEVTLDYIDSVLARNKYIDGVTLSGGDPLASIDSALSVAKLIKEKYHLNLWTFTGYTFQDLLKMGEKDSRILSFLTYVDVLVDGPFILSQRDISLRYRGSKNQSLINVQKSLKEGKIVKFLFLS